MDISSLVFNSSPAGLIITLAAHSILISLFGIAIIKLFKKSSAPVRSLLCSCVTCILGLAVIVSAGFILSGISWSGLVYPEISFEAPGPTASIPEVYNKADNILRVNPAKEYHYSADTGLNPVSPRKKYISAPEAVEKTDIISFTGPFKLSPSFIFFINLLGIIWLTGMLYFLTRLGYGFIQISKFKKSLKPVTGIYFTQMAHTVSKIFSGNRAPGLYSSRDIESPVTIGLFKPVTVIPEKLSNSLNEDELKSILLHEFSHIYHHDQVMGVIKRIVSAFHWWNPIVYIINRIHEQAREEVSDNYVLRDIPPKIYTRCLANLAEKVSLIGSLPAASCMAGRYPDLHTRAENILSKKRRITMNTKLYLKAVTFGIGLFLTFGIAGFHGNVESKTITDEIKAPDPAPQKRQEVEIKYTGTKITEQHNKKTVPESIKEERKTVAAKDMRVRNTVEPLPLKRPENPVKNLNPAENEAQKVKSEKPVLTANLDNKITLKEDNKPAPESSDQVQEKKSSAPKPEHYTADDYFYKGKDLLENGNPEKAVTYFNRSIELGKKTAEVYLARGNAYTELNNLEEAIADCSKAIDLKPDYADTYNNRGAIFFRMQEYKKSIEDFNAAVKISPDHLIAYYNRAGTYLKMEKLRKAFTDYTMVIKLEPAFPHAYIGLGKIYLKEGEFKKAEKEYTKAIELGLKETEVYIGRAFINYRIDGDCKKVINDVSKAIEINPEQYSFYAIRSAAYYNTGEYKKAKHDFSKAIKINPSLNIAYAPWYRLTGITLSISSYGIRNKMKNISDWARAGEQPWLSASISDQERRDLERDFEKKSKPVLRIAPIPWHLLYSSN